MNNQTKVYQDMFQTMINWVNNYLNQLSDDDLENMIYDEGNSGKWILAHLIACDDDLALYLGKGDLLYPEHYENFKSGAKPEIVEYPSTSELRKMWDAVCARNLEIYSSLTDKDLDQPHALIEGNPEEDYFKTKRRVLNNWMNHQVYHAGQLGMLLAKRKKHPIEN